MTSSIIDYEKLFHIIFQSGPLLLIFYFLFQSILNWELRGIIYIIGLFISSSIIYLCNNPFLSIFPLETNYTKNAVCNSVTLGINNQLFSEIPLSIGVYTYTFVYLLMFIIGIQGGNVKLQLKQNISILVLFPLFILLESIHLLINNCISNPLYAILFSMIISSIIGCLWGLLIISLKNNKLYYINNMNSGDVCVRPSKTYLKCVRKKI
jgi:hypothetical protein